jgi:Butyrate kinase
MEGKEYHLLIINIGSVSTKVYLYRNEENLISETVYHSFSQLSHFHTINDQLPFRREVVEEIIKKDRKRIDIVVSRGDLQNPSLRAPIILMRRCVKIYIITHRMNIRRIWGR